MILKLLSLVSCHWKLRPGYFKTQIEESAILSGHLHSLCVCLPGLPLKCRSRNWVSVTFPGFVKHYTTYTNCTIQSPWILVRNLIPHPPWFRGSTFANVNFPIIKCLILFLQSSSLPIFHSLSKGKRLPSLASLYFIPSDQVITASFFNLPGD